jgi:hypothetical protein
LPLQHCVDKPHVSPFEKHEVALGMQTLSEQVALQQSLAWRHAPLSSAHPHMPLLQAPMQQSLAAVHAWPWAMHPPVVVLPLPPVPITIVGVPFAHAPERAASARIRADAEVKREASNDEGRDMAERYPFFSATASRSHSLWIVSPGHHLAAQS